MQIKKNDVNKTLTIFLLSHVIIWTLIPTFSNINLPLDTIEALAWGSDLDWGYNKHPPLSAFVVEVFYQLFKNQDWAYYFLSQLFVISSFFIVWKFSEDFFQNKIYGLISVLLLEGIYFYNFTTPEFNVYVCQLPFRALTVYFCWKSLKNNDTTSWLLFGLFAALGFLSHYLFLYLIVAIIIFFTILLTKQKKFNLKYLEKEEFIKLTDSIHSPSKLHFIVDNTELYRFQVANVHYDSFIKLLLRSYSGLFENYVTINEQTLSSRFNSPPAQILDLLEKLQQLEILKYLPRTNVPKLVFTKNRAEASTLRISEEILEKKELTEEYLNKVVLKHGNFIIQ